MKRVGEMLPPTGNKTSKNEDANSTMKTISRHDDVCEICGGLGWVSPNVPVGDPQFGKLTPCPHRQDEVRQKNINRAWTDLGPLRDMTYKNFQTEGHRFSEKQSTSLKGVYAWLFIDTGVSDKEIRTENSDGWVDNPRGWVLLQGGYGCGKTHLAAAIANICMGKGTQVMFVNVPDLLDYLRAAYGPSSEETFDQRFIEVRDAPLLILDDFGTQNATSWAEEKLYQILNARYVSKRPTVITTNLELDDFDPRIRSRLSDQNLVRKHTILAPDFRRGDYDKRIESSVSSLALYSDKTFENFDKRVGEISKPQQANLGEALKQAKGFAANPYGWIMFTGNSGVGKTHLAAAIANHQANEGNPVLFVVVPDLLDHLRSTFAPDSRTSFDQRFEEVRTAPLLVLDDLGTESATPWAREKLFQIINHRYVAQLPTIITTSVSPKDFDQRIYTRISDEAICVMVNLAVPIYRRSTNEKQQREKRSTKRK